MVFSTYLGGSGEDGVRAVTLDGLNGIYVAGGTASANFPTANAAQNIPGGGGDGFLAKLNANGASLAFSTFLGGSAYDEVAAIGRDPAGAIYVGGSTFSADFPVMGTIQPFNLGKSTRGMRSWPSSPAMEPPRFTRPI